MPTPTMDGFRLLELEDVSRRLYVAAGLEKGGIPRHELDEDADAQARTMGAVFGSYRAAYEATCAALRARFGVAVVLSV